MLLQCLIQRENWELETHTLVAQAYGAGRLDECHRQISRTAVQCLLMPLGLTAAVCPTAPRAAATPRPSSVQPGV